MCTTNTEILNMYLGCLCNTCFKKCFDLRDMVINFEGLCNKCKENISNFENITLT